ncbi:MAG: DUF4007 family protein [Lachnospiraceae bacterium]|nr:DUF4007 family protein [Lachnospiraceae bacterium]
MATINYRFKGHEKFPLREGWLNKGMAVAFENNETAFKDSEGPDRLGVGTNMVKSIKYWLKAFELIEDKGLKLTEFGRIIYENDMYLEDDFTWWLLHSTLAKSIKNATTWYLFFNKCDIEEFSRENLKKIIYTEAQLLTGNPELKELAINDDIDVLINMYCKNTDKDNDPEDKIISPMSKLGLLKKIGDNYVKEQPALNSFSEWIILYELFSMFEMEKTDNISIDRFSTGELGVGRLYNLSKVAINEYLDLLEKQDFIRVVRTAGLDIIYKSENEDISAKDIIIKYYNEFRTR